MEHNDSHATFLDLDISIDKGKLIYRMFDKRDTFKFHIVKLPSTTNNIPSSTTLSEFGSIDRSKLLVKEFLLVAKNLLEQMINQGGSKHMLSKQIENIFNRHSEAFQKYHIFVSKITATQINAKSVSDNKVVEQTNSDFWK